MELPDHTLNALFAQLGLPDSDNDIDNFIERHKGVDKATPLAQAAFWNEGQAAFLSQAIQEDADWAEVVDHLDALLRT
ncbi:DUF2789 domain-containing protein [Thiomicrorhabdus sp. 6S3-12]|uniref:DUF2789 domain-containing protein n=1 Tax=Thiomicrorhabdus sp. 6S3-12 TaxID=2819681 RepID=UPI001AAD26DC|nr:DUF2789 domain-containing protein [Thiomicrorhabdus sp. 6S3-12]MBO1925049.1 DUF2789 domain-containing protein [Thiomicrorhabdus sp. 6S3-12]